VGLILVPAVLLVFGDSRVGRLLGSPTLVTVVGIGRVLARRIGGWLLVDLRIGARAPVISSSRVIRVFLEHGDRLRSRLVGDFALALVCRAVGSLCLLRDRITGLLVVGLGGRCRGHRRRVLLSIPGLARSRRLVTEAVLGCNGALQRGQLIGKSLLLTRTERLVGVPFGNRHRGHRERRRTRLPEHRIRQVHNPLPTRQVAHPRDDLFGIDPAAGHRPREILLLVDVPHQRRADVVQQLVVRPLAAVLPAGSPHLLWVLHHELQPDPERTSLRDQLLVHQWRRRQRRGLFHDQVHQRVVPSRLVLAASGPDRVPDVAQQRHRKRPLAPCPQFPDVEQDHDVLVEDLPEVEDVADVFPLLGVPLRGGTQHPIDVQLVFELIHPALHCRQCVLDRPRGLLEEVRQRLFDLDILHRHRGEHLVALHPHHRVV